MKTWMKHRFGQLTIGLCATTCVVAHAVETAVPSYGAATFVPTPQTPIGYRANGNGWYPGATPPAEWWEGTPVQKDVGVAFGDSRYSPKDPNHRQDKVWTLGDTKSKNILWNSPIPGWGDAQPIVVGDRVIACADPDVVICYDANDGKVLWQDRLNVMTLPMLGDDRKTLVQPMQPVAAWQHVWELTRAYYLLEVQVSQAWDDPAILDKAIVRVDDWRKSLSADLPPTLGQGLERVARKIQDLRAAPDAETRKKMFFVEGADPGLGRRNAFLDAFSMAKPRVTTSMVWQGYVNGSFSTPVSDGRLVVVCFAYGQFAAYEVATGKRVWAFRDPLVPHAHCMNHGASPWMFQDLVLVRSGDGQAIMGLDKATGVVRWETAIQTQARGRGANHGNYVTPVLMRVPEGKGPGRWVLVTQDPPILDPLTGAEIGRLEIGGKKPRSTHGSMVGGDGLVFSCWGYDSSPSPGYRHSLISDGKSITVEELPAFDGSPGGGANAILFKPGVLLGDSASLFDPSAGGKSRPTGSGDGGSPAVLCGDILVTRASQSYGNRIRQDFAVTTAFITVDLKDPRAPKVLSRRNLLGGDALPADPIFDAYMVGFDKKVNIGCYKGLAAWFGCRVGGVVPKGDRLYIQSSVGMYCIAAPGSPPLAPIRNP